jgi:DNA mismatch repair ATPase MutS
MSPDSGSYGDWFALANVRHYYKTNAIVFRERAFLRACWLRCASLEADTALARHLQATPAWCWAATGAGIIIEDGIHPLLAAPTGLSIALNGEGAFISGPNGAGKSTFLRMVGLNLVLARAFGFCYARAATLPMLPVYASMQNEDSLLDGQSLYISELARARALLAAAEGPHPGVCLVDEIFRGTNHVESVAAAAAVLDTLAARSMVLVSSHNLVLASLLEHRLAPHCLGRDAKGRLTLAPGVLDRTNGIALLGVHGFGMEIEHKAQKVALWLTGYLGQPEAGAHVLGDAHAEEITPGAAHAVRGLLPILIGAQYC